MSKAMIKKCSDKIAYCEKKLLELQGEDESYIRAYKKFKLYWQDEKAKHANKIGRKL